MLDKGDWVSVNDRLPDTIGLYLVFEGDRICTQPYNENGWLNMYDALFITHWMELPKPPEKEL